MNDESETHLHADHILAMRVRLLIEEYRAVHQLLMFRLEAMEQRLPLTGAGIGALLVAVSALPWVSQVILLICLPLAVLFWTRSILFHALSKEDAKERIREIESEVAALCGEPVLRFQSEHPSATGPIGGRTAAQAIYLALVVGGSVLLTCHSLFTSIVTSERLVVLYGLGLCLTTFGISHALFQYAIRQPRVDR